MNKKEEIYLLSQEYSIEHETDHFVKYMEEKANLFDEEINLIYNSLNDIIILSKFKKLNEEKARLENNVDVLSEKNLTLESDLTVLKEENQTKDCYIKRLEEEINLLQKENYHILNEIQEIELKASQEVCKRRSNFVRLNSFNQNFIELNEEKNNLELEITELQSKIRHLESEIKTKYILKTEHNKEILNLERENKSLNINLKNYETSNDKLKHEYQSLKRKNGELKQSICNYEKKIEDINNNALAINLTSNNNSLNGSHSTPLNILFENHEEYLNESKNQKVHLTGKLINNNNSIVLTPKEKPNLTYTELKINNNTVSSQQVMSLQNTRDNKIGSTQVNEKMSSRRSICSTKPNQQNNLLNELKDDSAFLEDNNSYGNQNENKISVTPNNIIQQMEKNEIYESIKNKKKINESYYKENGNPKVFPKKSKLQIEIPKLNLKREIPFNNEQYRDFFLLTYQACKMNFDDIEPFLYVYIV